MSDICTVDFKMPQKNNNTLIPVSHGEEQCLPNHSWGAGVRSCYLIHYIISGNGTFYCGPNKYQLRKGQLFVIFPGTIVKYQADEQDPWHYIWVTFYGDGAKDILNGIGLSLTNPVMDVKNSSEIIDVLRNMPSERGADISGNLKSTAKLYEFMSLLASNENETDKNENIYLETAIRYIKSYYHENISVEQIALHIGISRKYLFAIFKKTLGISPKDYIIDYRINRAKEFLADKTLPIGNIAYSVGYRDQLTFSKIFKLKTGLSPSEYRLKN